MRIRENVNEREREEQKQNRIALYGEKAQVCYGRLWCLKCQKDVLTEMSDY